MIVLKTSFFILKIYKQFHEHVLLFKSMVVTILNCAWSSFPCRIFLQILRSLFQIVFILIHTTFGHFNSVPICCTSAWEYLQPLHYLCSFLNPLHIWISPNGINIIICTIRNAHTYLYTHPFCARLGFVHVAVCMRCEARVALKSQPMYSLLVRIKTGALKTYSFAFFPFELVHILSCAKWCVCGIVRSIRDGIN